MREIERKNVPNETRHCRKAPFHKCWGDDRSIRWMKKELQNDNSKIQEAFELSPQLVTEVTEDGTAILCCTTPTDTWTRAEETHISCYFVLLLATRTGSSWFPNAWRLLQTPIFCLFRCWMLGTLLRRTASLEPRLIHPMNQWRRWCKPGVRESRAASNARIHGWKINAPRETQQTSARPLPSAIDNYGCIWPLTA